MSQNTGKNLEIEDQHGIVGHLFNQNDGSESKQQDVGEGERNQVLSHEVEQPLWDDPSSAPPTQSIWGPPSKISSQPAAVVGSRMANKYHQGPRAPQWPPEPVPVHAMQAPFGRSPLSEHPPSHVRSEPYPPHMDPHSSVHFLQNQLQQAQAEIFALRSRLTQSQTYQANFFNQYQAQIAGWQQEKQASQNSISGLQEETSQLRAQLTSLNGMQEGNNQFQQQVTVLQGELEASRQAFAGVSQERDAARQEVASMRNGMESQSKSVSKLEMENADLKRKNVRLDKTNEDIKKESLRRKAELGSQAQEYANKVASLNQEIAALKGKLVTAENVVKQVPILQNDLAALKHSLEKISAERHIALEKEQMAAQALEEVSPEIQRLRQENAGLQKDLKKLGQEQATLRAKKLEADKSRRAAEAQLKKSQEELNAKQTEAAGVLANKEHLLISMRDALASAEQRAANSEQKLAGVEQRLIEAEQRATSAEKRAADAEQRAAENADRKAVVDAGSDEESIREARRSVFEKQRSTIKALREQLEERDTELETLQKQLKELKSRNAHLAVGLLLYDTFQVQSASVEAPSSSAASDEKQGEKEEAQINLEDKKKPSANTVSAGPGGHPATLFTVHKKESHALNAFPTNSGDVLQQQDNSVRQSNDAAKQHAHG
jgi:chromosome segregation ATPase